MFLRYDGTFAGFLSAVAVRLRQGGAPGLLRPGSQLPLLPVEDVPTEDSLVERMGPYLAERTGPEVPGTVYQAWLSGQEGIDDAIVSFLREGLRRRTDPSGLRQIPDIAAVVRASARVGREAHRFLGLVRFRLRGHLYVAEIEPDTDILPLIGDHFSERLHDQDFAIRDLRRGTAVLHPAGCGWSLVEMPPVHPEVGGREDPASSPATVDGFETLWKRYFQVMAIEERRNPDLQRNFLPRKHWRHLVEEPGRRATEGIRQPR